MRKALSLFFLALALIHSPLSAKKSEKYEYKIAACLMFYNESFFLKEWLEYHKLIGVEHFYLFNNGSTDNYLEILQPYLNSGEVELYDYPERGKSQPEHNNIQCVQIYNHALSLARGKAKWLAIIDADEFIFPVKNKPLAKILEKYEAYGGLYVDYMMFGTAHVEKIPSNKTIIESLTRCAGKPMTFGKSIVRPERVSNCSDPHRMWYNHPYYHVDTNCNTFDWLPEKASDDTLLIHHYYTGDIDHALNVCFPRRRQWVGIVLETYLQELESLNAVENKSMLRYVPALRTKLHLPSSA